MGAIIVFALFQGVILIIEGVIVYNYCEEVFLRRDRWHFSKGIWMALYTAIYGLSFCGVSWVNIVGFLIANFLIILLLYNVSIQGAILNSFMLTAIMCLCEMALIPLQSIEVAGFLQTREYEGITIMLAAISKLLYFLVVRVMASFFSQKNEKEIKEKHFYLISLVPALSIMLFCVMLVICIRFNISGLYQIALSGCFLAILVVNLIVFWEYGRIQKDAVEKSEMQIMIQKQKDDEAYFQLLFRQDQMQKVAIHDFKKHLMYIKELYVRNEGDEVGQYVDNLNLQLERSSTHFSDNAVLDLILNHYKEISSEKDVSFAADIRFGTMDDFSGDSITSLFGNLLENALFSAEKSTERYIDISACKVENGGAILIKAINSCDDNPFMNGELRSSKKDPGIHGYGIKSIKQVVEKHKGAIEMYYNSDFREFHTVIRM